MFVGGGDRTGLVRLRVRLIGGPLYDRRRDDDGLACHRGDCFGGVKRAVEAFVDEIITVGRDNLTDRQALSARLDEQDVPGAQVESRARQLRGSVAQRKIVYLNPLDF